METTGKFMVLFRMPMPTQSLTAAKIAENHEHWQRFLGAMRLLGTLEQVSRLSFEGYIILPDYGRSEAIQDENGQIISGMLIIATHDQEKVLETAKTCPVLFSGGSVEVRVIVI